ncbi:MAG: hypothetical protein M3Q69_09200 [Acidobacteriota bacterium]|nr:hypothetical protein [Acidobacteriota bacterium]
MRITITTDGGFTGRGIGSASAEIDDARIAQLHCDQWRAHYGAPGADLVHYTLTVGGRSVTWSEGAAIPSELAELFEEVWTGTN